MEAKDYKSLSNQNLILSILCVLLVMAVIGLMVWLWFGQEIEHVDHQIKSLR